MKLLSLILASAACGHSAPRWTAAYSLPAFSPADAIAYHGGQDYAGQTVREVVRLNLAGERLRLKFTNETGDAAVALGGAYVAPAGPDGAPVRGMDRQITFGGARAVTVPKGAPLYSDPVDLPTPAFGDLVVSTYFPGPGPVRLGGHLDRVEVVEGDIPFDSPSHAGTTETGPAFVSRIDVMAARPTKVLVAIGDSITEGWASTPGAHRSWPEQFARRLDASPYGRSWSVVASGVAGNRVLRDGTGANLLSRLDRDALDTPGVAALVVLEGINDIGDSKPGTPDQVTPADLIAGLKQVIARAHARGLRVYGGTMTPFEGAAYFTPGGEATRAAVNAWIRSGGDFDGVIDFDAAARDPLHPRRLSQTADSGDHLHPGDAGYALMAKAVSLNILAEPPGPDRQTAFSQTCIPKTH